MILGYKNFNLSRLHSQVAEAAERGRALLMETGGAGPFGRETQRMLRAYNQLIQENARMAQAGKGYLGQIQTTLGNLREAVVMVDDEQVIRLANPAFGELVGVHSSPLQKRLDGFIQGTGFQEFLMEMRRNGDAQRREIEVQIHERRRWLEISAASMPDNPGSTANLKLYVFHDITRQKGLEKMRTEFVANASHELRTPVTIIKGFADTLLEDDEHISPEERKRFLQKIGTHAERLNLLLRDLLFLSRLESTGSVLHREKWSVAKLVVETGDSWRGVLDEGQDLRYDVASGEDIVFADSLRFSQVLINLLENARRHAKGFSKITVRTEIEEGGVYISVIDDGCGIPEKDLPHIFQRFYRVEKGRSRESGGTGLGLAIVKHIVQEHGGEVSASSQRNKGTEIRVFLPSPDKMVQNAMYRGLEDERSKSQV